jgi:hypothetical protein
VKCRAAVVKAAMTLPGLRSVKSLTKPKMSGLSRMWRRRATRNSVRVNGRRAVTAHLGKRVNRANRVSPDRRVNRARNVRRAGWIAATVVQLTAARANVFPATVVLVTLIVRWNVAAANANRVAVPVIVLIAVANVRRCASARRWIATVDQLRIVAAEGLLIGIVDRVI